VRATGCPRETAIVAAVRSGSWEDDLRTHAATCTDCAETVRVAGLLRALAAQDLRTPLPEAAEIYRRARLVERLFGGAEAGERAARSVVLAEALAFLALAAGLVVWLAASWTELAARLSTGQPRWLESSPAPSAAFAWIVLASAAGALMLLAMLPILRTED